VVLSLNGSLRLGLFVRSGFQENVRRTVENLNRQRDRVGQRSVAGVSPIGEFGRPWGFRTRQGMGKIKLFGFPESRNGFWGKLLPLTG